MKRRVVVLTEIIAPYRIPVFNALAQHDGLDAHVIFLSETDPSLRQWKVYKDEIRFQYTVLSSWRRRLGRYNLLVNRGLRSTLDRLAPQTIVCGGYSYLASWKAALWARSHGVPFLLWSESTDLDQRRSHGVVEFLKSRFLGLCDGFVVPGVSSRAYLMELGIPETKIFTAPNAVDIELFQRETKIAKGDASSLRQQLGLPLRFFLYVGRVIRDKGVFDLLEAYAKLEPGLRSAISLVLAGDGVDRQELLEHASRIVPGEIRFAGFVQREQLPAYYALAEAFVFPTLSDPWGLAVNEAMSCGLPVITTEVAGCAADLVKEGWNGFVVPPHDVSRLSQAMQQLARQPDLVKEMAARSAQHILRYSPQAWALGLAEAVLASRARLVA